MLIEFEVGNFRSFNAPVRLSLVAARPIKEFQADNVFVAGRHRLLTSAAVYGANASGKSNLLDALVQLRWLVLNSSKDTQAKEPIDVVAFKFDTAARERPSRFEVRIWLGGFTYRYGVELDRRRVHAEWLFRAHKVAEAPLFLRSAEGIEVFDAFAEGRSIERKTRDNALFLSVVAQFNGDIANALLGWFRDLTPLHGLDEAGIDQRSLEILQDPERRGRLLGLIRASDVGIQDIQVEERAIDTSAFTRYLTEEGKRLLPKEILERRGVALGSVHAVYENGAQSGTTTLDFVREESEGTKRLLRLAGTLLDCLEHGRVAVVDELDARLHPLLSLAVVRLFHSSKTNPKHAQLVFATHDTNLLRCGAFRRDQVWFVEKNRQEASDLYSLAEIKLPRGSKVRNDAAYAKNYLAGRYGAVPFIGELAEGLAGQGDG